MVSDWGISTLENAGVTLIDCVHKTPADAGIGIPYIAIPQLKNGRIDFSAKPRLISDQDYEKWTVKAKPQTYDIVLSRRCNPGETAFVPEDTKFALGQNLVLLRSSGEIVFPQFLRWLVRGPEWWEQVSKFLNVGAVFDSLRCAEIPKFELILPPISEQKAIAHILGSLDDKIELNRQMNETLESMAQALFKSWFVDFDPVIDNALAAGNLIPDALKARAAERAKIRQEREQAASASEQASSSTNEHQALFPSEFEYTEEMGWIPKGWSVKSVGELVDSVSETYPLKTAKKVIFLNTSDIQEGQFLHNDYTDAEGLPGQAKKSIKIDDILYSEIRPKNKRFAYVNFDSSDYVVSTKLMVLRSSGEVKSLFTYFVLKQKDKISYLQHMAESRSGTFPQITFEVLSKIKLALPSNSYIVDSFINTVLEPNFDKINTNIKNNQSLSKLRDTLLPKLLSGELRIPDAKKLVEDAMQ